MAFARQQPWPCPQPPAVPDCEKNASFRDSSIGVGPDKVGKFASQIDGTNGRKTDSSHEYLAWPMVGVGHA
jgi:hypothetical protein